MKTVEEQSLRYQVDKWLAPTTTRSVHVIRFSRTCSDRRRFVCIESSHPVNSHALFFFRHDDGCWRVFPALPDRPQFNVERRAA
ncbi:conserved hypothetical protein [Burkholderia sp. H160]|nr:conserved hypothetical protein [Burkholderia sp. H160]